MRTVGVDELEDHLADVLDQVRETGLIEKLPAVSTWHERCHARHAYKKAFADQVAVFKEHAPPG